MLLFLNTFTSLQKKHYIPVLKYTHNHTHTHMQPCQWEMNCTLIQVQILLQVFTPSFLFSPPSTFRHSLVPTTCCPISLTACSPLAVLTYLQSCVWLGCKSRLLALPSICSSDFEMATGGELCIPSYGQL